MPANKNRDKAADGGLRSTALVRHAVEMLAVVVQHSPPISHMWAVVEVFPKLAAAQAHAYAEKLRACDDVTTAWGTARVVKTKVSFSLPNADGLGRRTLDADSK